MTLPTDNESEMMRKFGVDDLEEQFDAENPDGPVCNECSYPFGDHLGGTIDGAYGTRCPTDEEVVEGKQDVKALKAFLGLVDV